ncbi:MAG: hypothetical protein A2Y40_00695 [Candidatus Margulisbacteria bacterium GWF2_35_9]|nr:MAG: hypothetical protein A2Y40_00695 [Candidatus Margulisbacteria bacterium GWF2_35_9]
MIKKMMLGIMVFLVSAFAFAIDAESVVGTWANWNDENTTIDSHVQIYRDGKEFKGKIVWLREPLFPADHEQAGKEKVDLKNGEEKLRTRKVLGLEMLYSFKYNSNDQRWVDGKVYNANDGKIYTGNMWLLDNGNLKLKGSIDAWGLIGKEKTWTRINSEQKE